MRLYLRRSITYHVLSATILSQLILSSDGLASNKLKYCGASMPRVAVTTRSWNNNIMHLSGSSPTRLPYIVPRYGERSTIFSASGSETELSEASFSEEEEGKIGDKIGAEEKNNTSPILSSNNDIPVSKFRKLKDIMWIREAREDVTAAEFACSVESAIEKSSRKKKRDVDYEKILANINKRIGDMTCEPFEKINGSEPQLEPDLGMGRYAYTYVQRVALLKKLLSTQSSVSAIVQKNRIEHELEAEERSFGFELPEIPELKVGIPKEEEASQSFGPKLYVRDDGTVDWEGALQDRAALQKFGGAVWARINGQTPDAIPEHDDEIDKATTQAQHGNEKPVVTAKIVETAAIREAREKLERLQNSLKEQEKAHLKLLNSGISAGSAVANVNLASLDPNLRAEIRNSLESLETLEQQVAFQNLVYELERIYTYLATDLGNPAAKGYVPLQDRLNVAEYGLLEGQIESCSRNLLEKGMLDADILAVISEQMTDFKRRLGIDYYVAGLTFDREAILSWLADISRQTKSGFMFYVKGCRLFWNDILFCSTLIARAAQGYTLKPREVRTIRRTFKDVITFIPVIIILIIPLSPVGHVLVFGAIQRFFPDFFPSCFTEQRQNLLQLYETAEYSEYTINESLQERFTRFLEAAAFAIATSSRNAYKMLLQSKEDKD